METACACPAGNRGLDDNRRFQGCLLRLSDHLKVRRILLEHPLALRMPARCRELLPACATLKTFAGGVLILKKGQPADRFHLALEDDVPVEWTCSDGGETATFTVSRQGLIGVSWCFPPHRWQCSLRLLRPAQLMVLDAQRLNKFLAADPDQCMELNTFLLHRFLQCLHHDPVTCPEYC